MTLKFSPDEVFVSSDFHLGHGQAKGEEPRGIIKHQKRPFASADEMDEAVIVAANDRVPKDAVLIFCGDWCWWDRFRDRNLSIEEKACRYRERVRCRNIYFIWGNHDKRLRSSGRFRSLFRGCYDMMEANVGGQGVVFTHPASKVWFGSRYGAWNIYGHSHNMLWEGLTKQELATANDIRKSLEDAKQRELFDRIVRVAMPSAQTDCGIDTRPQDFAPYSWSEIASKIKAKELTESPDLRIGADGAEDRLERFKR